MLVKECGAQPLAITMNDGVAIVADSVKCTTYFSIFEGVLSYIMINILKLWSRSLKHKCKTVKRMTTYETTYL